jgi:hypothetical protein
MEAKKWYLSKTLWVNVAAILAIVLNSRYGIELDAEVQATMATGLLAVVNIILRLMTGKPVRR